MRPRLQVHRSPTGPRPGVALLTMVVALAVLSMVLSATTWQVMAQRRTLERRFHRDQAIWLARAGIERAAGRLLADPTSAREETVELIPELQLRVRVDREPGPSETFQVTSESRFPTNAAHPVIHGETRRLQRVVEAGRARILVIPEGGKMTDGGAGH